MTPSYEETPETLRALSREAGLDLEYVTDVMADVHYVIDSLVADDFNVLLGPLYFIRSGNPVVPAMVEHFTREDWRASEGLKTADAEVLAKALHLSVDTVVANPCVFGTHVVNEVADWRRVPPPDEDEFRRIDRVIWAWRHRMEKHGVTYRVRPVGRESAFESWLVDNLHVLADANVHAELVADQVPLDGGRRRADLICRLTEPLGDLRRGDLLVIENKATPVGMPALTQLREYVDLVQADQTEQQVGGMLIADGTTVALQEALFEAGFIYESLTSLGYREHLYRIGKRPTELDVVPETEAALQDPVEADLPGNG